MNLIHFREDGLSAVPFLSLLLGPNGLWLPSAPDRIKLATADHLPISRIYQCSFGSRIRLIWPIT
jgi:hypothetical protein